MNCVFQYWLSRPVLPGAEAGAAAMAAYAKRIGADHRFARHETFTDRLGVDARWFDKLRPVYDPAFDRYERILVSDVDVFPVDGLTANIFEEPCTTFAMALEPDQPELRERFPTKLFSRATDERWASWVETWGCRVPRDDKGRPLVFNAGVILYTRKGMDWLRGNLPQPADYVRAAKRAGMPATYQTEQSYLNAIAALPVARFASLSVEWNRQILRAGDGSTYDRRTPQTKFVHVMLRAADHNDAAWHHALVNGAR